MAELLIGHDVHPGTAFDAEFVAVTVIGGDIVADHMAYGPQTSFTWFRVSNSQVR